MLKEIKEIIDSIDVFLIKESRISCEMSKIIARTSKLLKINLCMLLGVSHVLFELFHIQDTHSEHIPPKLILLAMVLALAKKGLKKILKIKASFICNISFKIQYKIFVVTHVIF